MSASTSRRTAYVHLHLTPGHYVVLCLVPDPKTHKLHADLGMRTELDVAGPS